MEAEEAEASKSDNNPLSVVNILLPRVFAIAVVVFLGYWNFPPIVNSMQVVNAWLDWFCLVTRNLLFVSVLVSSLVFLIYITFPKTTVKNKPDLYDQYIAAVHPPPDNYFREFENYDDGYHNKSNHKEMVSAFEVVKECHCYDRVVMEHGDSKSYRRKRSEKKERTVEYRRMESKRVAKTASCGSQTIDELSSEEFEMTVETCITEKKMFIYQNGVVDQRQNGVLDQCVPQWQNPVANQRLRGVPQWQRSPEDRTGRSRRNHRLEGGSGPYLAISN